MYLLNRSFCVPIFNILYCTVLLYFCRASAAYAVVQCPSVRPSDRSCIVLKQTYSQTFLPSDIDPPFKFFCAKRYGNIPRGRRLQVGYEKIAIFDHYLALSRKWYKIGPLEYYGMWRMVSFPVTLSNLWRSISKSNNSNMVQVRAIYLQRKTNSKSYMTCQMVPFSMTLNDL